MFRAGAETGAPLVSSASLLLQGRTPAISSETALAMMTDFQQNVDNKLLKAGWFPGE